MTTMFTPYLNFDGTCRDAFNFYESVIGGELSVMANDDMPPDAQLGAEWEGRVVHASLALGEASLMGSDTPPDAPVGAISGSYVSLRVDSIDDAERIFAAFAEGGEVQMPLDETFFAARFGSVVDRFGTPWMIDCEHPES
jgi:PhnB protein